GLNIRNKEVGKFDPEKFEEVIETLDKKKERMREYYQKALGKEISPKEKKEANLLIIQLKAEIESGKLKMRTSEDFAYFYEYAIMDKKFIKRLQDVLK
ncbi:hypothetical protein CO024_00570, partial [Candidatus Gracilibacteria bacterium CG_4_9_14_0_2_um_filter_38_7]